MSPEGLAAPRHHRLPPGALDVADRTPGSVATVFGTRPEIIKLAGIIEILGSGSQHDLLRTAFRPTVIRHLLR